MKQKLKILHYMPVYAPAWQFGGPVKSVSQLCEGLVQQGHEVEVFTSNAGLSSFSELPLNQAVMRNGVRVNYFAQTPGFGIACPGMESAVRRRAKEFDIIHITGVWQRTSFAACQAAKSNGIPYVVSPRGALGPYSWQQKRVKKTIYYWLKERFNVKNALGIHYTTEQEKDECGHLKLPGKPFVIPNGFDFENWLPNSEKASQWREEHGFNSDSFLMLNVGRLHHKKGLDLLPIALAPLRGLNWRLVFVGNCEDDTKTRLNENFKTYGLLEHVRFLDLEKPEKLPAIYSAANLFLLPSRHENFGNVVVEALACCCPVMISAEVGLHREVETAGVGWVVPRVAKDWTNRIDELIQNKTGITEVRLRTRKWAEQVFSYQKTAFQMANQY
ncbi:MAG: glycosyltransferase, partial [SAR324 cluster bacterium]|nr:glycosyltransferase [SAR324 cluster bacterium]